MKGARLSRHGERPRHRLSGKALESPLFRHRAVDSRKKKRKAAEKAAAQAALALH
jgi:hypothetical protein